MAENGVIGRDGELPWPSIPADKRQYRERIADSPVILGRVTFDSMRDDLPGTAQIAMNRSADRAYVIGGIGIYTLFQPVVDRMVLSRIPGEYDGDAYFPEWNSEEWDRATQVDYDDFTLEEWVREST